MSRRDTRVRDDLGRKLCIRCTWKPEDQFYKSSQLQDGLDSYCKTCRKDFLRDHNVRNWHRYVYRNIRSKAKRHGIPFNLEPEDIEIPDRCPVLGIPLSKEPSDRGGATPNSISVDRIDPTLGYVKGNIQIISMRANAMKNAASPDELRSFARWVVATYGDEPS